MRDAIDRWAQKRWLLVIVLMATYSAQSLLITSSKGRGGAFAYDANSAVLLAEALKLCFAFAMLPAKSWSNLKPSLHTLVYAVPAVLYTVQNVLVFAALRRLTPPEYQLLNNMKLFSTSFVYRLAMQRQLRLVQWLALLLLGLGMGIATRPAAATAPGALPSAGADAGGADDGLDIWQGFLIMSIVAWCSACAGVLNEWLIKRSPSVMEANVWLYSFGTMFAVAQVSYSTSGYRFLVLDGFTQITWLVVLCNACLGQTIAFLFKYADSIVKLYAVCAAMGFTTAVSVAFFGFELHFGIVAGFTICGVSIVLYYLPSETLQATDSALLAAATGGGGKCDPEQGMSQKLQLAS